MNKSRLMAAACTFAITLTVSVPANAVLLDFEANFTTKTDYSVNATGGFDGMQDSSFAGIAFSANIGFGSNVMDITTIKCDSSEFFSDCFAETRFGTRNVDPIISDSPFTASLKATNPFFFPVNTIDVDGKSSDYYETYIIDHVSGVEEGYTALSFGRSMTRSHNYADGTFEYWRWSIVYRLENFTALPTSLFDVNNITETDLLQLLNDSITTAATWLVAEEMKHQMRESGVWTGEGVEYQGTATLLNVVPIPPAVWLFGSGLLGLIGIARRKKA